MADAAEEWLRKHDPDYGRASETWKHVRSTGEYRTPRQEIPWGNSGDLALLVDAGAGRYVESIDRRTCDRCHQDFVPVTPWNRFCSEICKKGDHEERRGYRDRAEYMRVYRRRKAA